MFNNLIESTSHVKEFKRRGSFVLLTTITYGVLLAVAGVASVYAYDAHLDSQSTELEITFVPLLPQAAQPEPPRNTIRPASNSDAPRTTQSIRTELIDSTSNPTNVPVDIGVKASAVPQARPDSIIGATNVDPPAPPASGRGGSNGTGTTPAVDVGTPPPPAPAPAPPPKVLKISTILNSKALSLPRPNYPPMAKQIHLQGMVTVQVMIDETGKVISAKATGHPLLVPEAQKAAMQARFSPTIIGETPVKVSGVITYNFVMP
ncbi:MAG TPA: TonB family protein [Pyrinomonadaceae bacterium]|jgi:protein TonB|nr:TonB family protein [Pyrinomonadaceae bacterium]